MSKKLFHCTIEYDYWCLAENEREAESFASDAINDFGVDQAATALEVTNKKQAYYGFGWEPNSLIYNKEYKNIKLGDEIDKLS